MSRHLLLIGSPIGCPTPTLGDRSKACLQVSEGSPASSRVRGACWAQAGGKTRGKSMTWSCACSCSPPLGSVTGPHHTQSL